MEMNMNMGMEVPHRVSLPRTKGIFGSTFRRSAREQGTSMMRHFDNGSSCYILEAMATVIEQQQRRSDHLVAFVFVSVFV